MTPRARTPRRAPLAGVLAGAVLLSGAAAVVVPDPAAAATAPAATATTATTQATTQAAERFAPSRVPDRITLTPADDPTTGQRISWRTGTEVTSPMVEYRTLTAASYPGGIQRAEATRSTEQVTDLGYTHVMHTAELSGLAPGTPYMYRVGDGTNFSEWQDFATATAGPSDFSFIYLGDLQNGIESQSSRVVRNAFRDRPNADIVLQIGDLVDDAEADADWGELYEAFDYTLGTQTMLTTPGNHEYEGGLLSGQWAGQFVYPDNGPQGSTPLHEELAGTAYYTDHQGVRFVSLNSNLSSETALAVQSEWLEEVLAENPQEWTVVFFHHPPYSLDEGRNNLGVRNSWTPIFEEYGVDLVLAGHDHAYARGNTLAGETNLPEGWEEGTDYTGPVYVVSSVGEKFYTPGPRHWLENDAHLRQLEAGKQFYQLIDIVGDELRYQARTADGVTVDGFTITSTEQGKKVNDGVPAMEIDPTEPPPCLGCEENPDPGEPDDPDPGEPGVPSGDFSYEVTASLTSVDPSMARLPAGVTFSESRDVLYLGDQNGRTIFEIDPETDEVLRQMELPENIRDLGIDDENDLLYVGQQNRNWVVVSTAEATFGDVVRGPFPIIESNRSLDVDPVNGFVYAAVPARGIEVFDAETGASLGVVNGTADAYYVAADPASGLLVSTKFRNDSTVINIEAFDATAGFAKVWEAPTRPNPRQVDIDSTNELLYVGYTGTTEDRGGFTVHDLATGRLLGDMVGPEYGKDGYGIVVDEERQRVFVANRDFRLNPPGEELTPVAVTVSTRVLGESFEYAPAGHLDAVDPSVARLPAGVTFSESRDLLYLGDQNGRTIFEIDPDTDEVLRQMELPENIRDLGIDDENDLLYVGQQNRNWVVVSIAEATFGEIVRGPFPIIESNRSLDVDPVNGFVYAAVPARGIEVFDAETGASLGVVNGTADAYYVAADPVSGLVVSTKSYGDSTTVDVEAFDATAGFAKVWGILTRAGSRQVDIDSTNKLLYVGYTGSTADRGGFSVHDLATGRLLVDMVGPQYGKDGYGIVVDEERQRVYVANRDFRLNPPGEELVPFSVTVTQRVLDGEDDGPEVPEEPGEEPEEPQEPGESGPGYTARALTVIPSAVDVPESDARPVGSVVELATGHVFVANEMRPARVWEIDPVTDAVVAEHSVPSPTAADDGVRDVALDEAAGELYVAYGNSWLVMDPDTAELVRGPFQFSANVRGMDIDAERGLVFGATRGAGFDVMDAVTGELVETVTVEGAGWRSHGVAFDPTTSRLYVSNSDADGSTEGVRVFDADFALVGTIPFEGADFRSITVDPVAGLLYAGHQSTTFDEAGVSVYSTATLDLVARLSDHEFGNKVYGISVNPETGNVYVSARDRHPAGLIELVPDPAPALEFDARALMVIPSAVDVPESDARPVGSVVELATGHVFVANEMRPARVWEIDPATDSVVAEHAVPSPTAADDGVRDVALDEAAGELYVAYGNSWLVMNPDSGDLVRGPFQFSANVRGMDIDAERGLVFGATRGAGFDVMDGVTGELVQTVTVEGAGWRSHGVAFDPTTSRLYVSNSDADASTEGVRVFDADFALVGSIPFEGADFRSITVDPVAGLLYAGHQSTTFDQAGVSAYSTTTLSLVARLSDHEFGNMVYGISVNPETGNVYVSARDRHPAGLIELSPIR